MLQSEKTQDAYDTVLSRLLKEKKKLSNVAAEKNLPQFDEDPDALKHYKYILPLVKEVHLLELKIKEKQQELKRLQQQKDTEKLAQSMLADSLREEDCVLKRWHRELTAASQKQDTNKKDGESPVVNNVVFHVNHEGGVFHERLAFTVLHQNVFIRVTIKSEFKCPCIHLLNFSSAKVGVTSDTFVPGLDNTVRTALVEGDSISPILSLVSKFISNDVAPFVIVIPMKKSKKKKGDKAKSKKTDENPDETKEVLQT